MGIWGRVDGVGKQASDRQAVLCKLLKQNHLSVNFNPFALNILETKIKPMAGDTLHFAS